MSIIKNANTVEIGEQSMGDLTDDILDGESCQLCGVPVAHGNGYPTYCSVDCAKDHGASYGTIQALKRDLREVNGGESE